MAINFRIEEMAYIRETDRLQTKNNKARKLVAELKQKVSELGDKTKNKAKQNEVLHEELGETEKPFPV